MNILHTDKITVCRISDPAYEEVVKTEGIIAASQLVEDSLDTASPNTEEEALRLKASNGADNLADAAYADWLEERGYHDEAERWRKIREVRQK